MKPVEQTLANQPEPAPQLNCFSHIVEREGAKSGQSIMILTGMVNSNTSRAEAHIGAYGIFRRILKWT